ncbi:MAG: aldehyde-activating protein [Sphingopyxis sp.]|nr:aldehyde-activating protein [Sphingopyxis sp.]
MTGACICGDVTVTLAEVPNFLNDCNCGLCRKLGVWWGYYPVDQVVVTGPTVTFCRPDRTTPSVDIHHCHQCGATTHFASLPHISPPHIGVNMRLFSAKSLQGIELRFPDGANWAGSGSFGYRREAVILDGISH